MFVLFSVNYILYVKIFDISLPQISVQCLSIINISEEQVTFMIVSETIATSLIKCRILFFPILSLTLTLTLP